METRKLSPSALAKEVGVSHVSVGNWLGGEIPKTEHLHRLSKIFGVKMEWFFTGEEPMYPEHKDEAYNIVEAKPRNWGGPNFGTSNWAPIVSEVAAGIGREFLDAEHAAPRVLVNCPDPNSYCVVVWGDSMEPIYRTGDVLVIAPSFQVTINDLVVFRSTDNEPFFKQYLGLRKGKHRFASLNPNHPMKEMEPAELQRMHPIHHVIRPLKGKIF